MKKRSVVNWVLLTIIAIVTIAWIPATKKKGLHRKYSVTTYEENKHPAFYGWYRRQPQYKLWLKKQAAIKLWQQKYAALPLPDSAVIVDEKTFATPNGRRTIIAWMTNTDAVVCPDEYEEAYYGCPTAAHGTGYFYGTVHFSLLNTAKASIINSIELTTPDSGDIAYPFSIANPKIRHDIYNLCYSAKGGSLTADGEADIIHFTDFNNDGQAYEFAMFDLSSCAPPISTLITYNPAKDRLIWQGFHMIQKHNTRFIADSPYVVPAPEYQDTVTDYWPGPAMTCQLHKDGTLNYYIDYRGRGGELAKYYFSYDKVTDSYSGLADLRDLPEDTTSNYSYMPSIREIRASNTAK